MTELDLNESASFGETLQTYRRPLTIGVIVLAAGAGGVWLWQRSGEIKEEKASALYAAGEAAFAGGNPALALTEFAKVTARYGSTNAGVQAAMLSAQILYEQGKHAEGLALLEAARKSAPEALRSGVQALIGAGLEATGKLAEAAAAYGSAVGGARFESEKDALRMEQARLLQASGDVAGAKALYEVVGGRDDSPYAGEARIRLGEISATS